MSDVLFVVFCVYLGFAAMSFFLSYTLGKVLSAYERFALRKKHTT